MMTVSQICRHDVDLVDLNESAWAAAERMHRRGVGMLFVVDSQKNPIGVVTDRDLVEKVLATERSPRTTRVHDIMTTPVKTIPQFASIEWVLSEICSSPFWQLPVVDAHGRLVGTVTLKDLIRLHG